MMHSNWLQGLLGQSWCEGVAWQFVKKSNRNQQSRKGDKWRKRQKIESNKKRRSERSNSYSVDHEHTKKRWKEGHEMLEEPKSHTFGGNPSGLLILFKYWKVRNYRDFFLGRTCKPFACKRNYFVLQSETATFACWRKWSVECINVIKWTMLKGNYFVFGCVSLTVRVFNFLNLCSCWMLFSIFCDALHYE